MASYDRVKVDNGAETVDGTDGAEVFIISNSNKNAETIRFYDFEYGSDLLHFGSRNSGDTFVDWVDDDGDGNADDLRITANDQEFVLVDLAEQIDAPTVYRFEQDFETNTANWDYANSGWYGTVSQVASGTNGVTSASGDFHAVFEGDNISAPFDSLLNQGAIPFDEHTVSLKIYLDPQADGGSGWADGEGFDYSVAASNASDDHLRDFIFHVTQDTSSGDMYVGASNNSNFAPREDLDNLANNAIISEDGWYTFEHRFYENNLGDLAVDLSVLDDDGTLIFQETRTNTNDDISNVNGDARYAWFTVIDVNGGIAVDDMAVSYEADQAVPVPAADDLFFV